MSALGITSADEALSIDLDRLIGSHACIVANSGGGKSGLIRRLLEVTHGHVQHIVLDGEDEFHTLREKFDYVIAGGDGGDVPVSVAGAADLAIATLTHGFSLIAQINDLGADGSPDFIGQFLEALVHAPRHLWRPVLIVVDEAQRFVPRQGATGATVGVKALLAQGRKRGFTAILAGTKLTDIDPGARGACNNWLLGRVGQSLDRRTMAEQLGFTAAEGRDKLRSMEPREFWAFGPALTREPTLFRVADVETTPVKAGQAKIATPPPPEALREILNGLSKTVESPSEVANSSSSDPSSSSDAEAIREKDERIAVLEGDLRAIEGMADAAYDRGVTAGIAIGLTRARSAIDALRIPDIQTAQTVGGEGSDAPNDGGSHVERSASRATRKSEASVPETGMGSAMATAGASPSPAATAIADLLDRVNPAKLTWGQAAALTGRKASGGNFNAARKWLRGSGRIIEEGEFIRSSAAAPAGMTRVEAIDMWKSVLTNPAPKMIDAFTGPNPPMTEMIFSKAELGAAIGAQPRGGNFNNGMAQLRRNGILDENAGTFWLAVPLPGEMA